MEYETETIQPTVSIKLIKNSKGYTWEISARGFQTVDEALEVAEDANQKLLALHPVTE